MQGNGVGFPANMRMSGRDSPHAPGTALLDIESVSAHYDGRTALDEISMQVTAGQRIAVVGPNGAGKSTLFKVVAGIHRPHHRNGPDLRQRSGPATSASRTSSRAPT